jgi:hypothetical protein
VSEPPHASKTLPPLGGWINYSRPPGQEKLELGSQSPRATTLTVKELPTSKGLIPYRGVALKRKTSTGS